MTTQAPHPVQPVPLGGAQVAPLGEAPRLDWIAISALRIDSAYQRSLSARSARMIRRIAANWDWAKVKALSVAEMPDGLFEVIDGQHTASAAASRGDITALPCLVSSRETLESRAEAFVGINRDRVAMTPLQIFWADVAAGNEDACDALAGVQQGGGRVLRAPAPLTRYEVGDVMSVQTIVDLAKRGGPAYVRRVVKIGVAAKLAPLREEFLRAITLLIWDSETPLTDDVIINVMRIHTGHGLLARAKSVREQDGGALFKALAAVIRRLA